VFRLEAEQTKNRAKNESAFSELGQNRQFRSKSDVLGGHSGKLKDIFQKSGHGIPQLYLISLYNSNLLVLHIMTISQNG